jgi:hypothetical protein
LELKEALTRLTVSHENVQNTDKDIFYRKQDNTAKEENKTPNRSSPERDVRIHKQRQTVTTHCFAKIISIISLCIHTRNRNELNSHIMCV